MNKLGIFMNFWEKNWDADHKKYIKKAAKLGFDVLEFQAQPLLNFEDAYLKDLKKVADEYGIELTYSLGLDKAYDISSDDAGVRDGGIEYLTAIMKKVSVMDGKLISGVSYAGWGVPAISDISKERLTENSIGSMKKLMKTAEELNILYAVEAVNRFEGVVLNTASEAVNYVNAVGSKNIGVLLDTYHMNIEEFSIGDAIRCAGDKLIGFHVGENNRSVPGRGHLNWDEIFGALSEIGYKGRIVAEPFIVKGGEVGRDIYVWRDLISETDEKSLDAEASFMLNFEKKMMEKWGM